MHLVPIHEACKKLNRTDYSVLRGCLERKVEYCLAGSQILVNPADVARLPRGRRPRRGVA